MSLRGHLQFSSFSRACKLYAKPLRSAITQKKQVKKNVEHTKGGFTVQTTEELFECLIREANLNVTRFYKTDPNCTSGKIKLKTLVDSGTIVLLVFTCSNSKQY